MEIKFLCIVFKRLTDGLSHSST